MSDLFDRVTEENPVSGEKPDAEDVYERFIELSARYDDEVSDPTTDQVDTLYKHYYRKDPEDLSDEELALMWTMCGIVQWLYDGLPTDGEMQDPEWHRIQAKIFDPDVNYPE
jgi:hypothetical protein